MRKLVALFMMLAFTASARAAVVNLTWTLPTQYEDNSALVPSDVASTTVEYGTCSGATTFGTKQGQVVATGSATATSVTVSPGTYCFRAFVTVIAAKGGQSSAVSNVAAKTVAFPAPKAPTLLDAVVAFLKRLFGHFA